ncbi:MAG: hypothetical protein KA714_05985 [Limnoraphis sp. WC205]|nr:hypothetical protein [Limnoraphis sp. WC205]
MMLMYRIDPSLGELVPQLGTNLAIARLTITLKNPVSQRSQVFFKNGFILGASKFILGASKFILGASKFILGASKFILGASKFILGASKFILGASKFILGASLAPLHFLTPCTEQYKYQYIVHYIKPY